MIRSLDTKAAHLVDSLSNAVVLAWGRRRAVIALAAGGISALAQPPYHAFFVLFLTLPVLVWLVDGLAPEKKGVRHWIWPAFSLGWLFGFGYFLAGLWWIGAAFLVDAHVFAWLLPFAVLLLPAGLAVFWGLGLILARLLWSDGWQRIFALAAGLGSAEWLRSHLFTGFPWNVLGYSLTAGEILMQSAWLLGLSTLSLVAVIIFASPAVLASNGETDRRTWWLPVTALLVLAGLAVFGLARLSQSPTVYDPNVQIRIVQPSIPQDEKWKPGNKRQIFDTLIQLTGQSAFPSDSNTLVVWPESTLPFWLTEERWALPAIADVLPENATLLLGAARFDTALDGKARTFNSAYLVNDKGEILDAYDKVHLTPFGEYLPFQETLEAIGLQQLTQIQGGFTPGIERKTMSIPGIPPFLTLICYEVIFPILSPKDADRPSFLLNITNDAWFGHTPGPYQHFHQARVRALETATPLVRSANSGISAVTDSYGRIVQSTRLLERTTLEGPLPISSKNTQYGRRHFVCFIFLLIISITLSQTNVSFRTTQG